MARTYKGTKITGNSTSAKKFVRSGISNAKVGQTYLNTNTGRVYQCAKKGGPSDATWRFTNVVDIIAKPSIGVKGLTKPERGKNGSYVFTAKWDVPDNLKSSNKCDRATGLKIKWVIEYEEYQGKKKTASVSKTVGINTKTASINCMNAFTVGGVTVSRQYFFPFVMRYLRSISVTITPYNGKGNSSKPHTTTATFQKPAKPQINNLAFNPDNGVFSFNITSDPGYDMKERYCTYRYVWIVNTRTGQQWHQVDDETRDTTWNFSYNCADYQQMAENDYIMFNICTVNRGLAGWTDHVMQEFYVSPPARPTIQGVDISEKNQNGKCTVRVDTNTKANKWHPVDVVRLEYLANCDYATKEQIPAEANWTSSDIVDDGSCTALSIPIGTLGIPDPGKYTWVRVRAHHLAENILYLYSTPWRVKQLETPKPTAADDKIDIIALTAAEDGVSLICELGWNVDGKDDSTGTELSWSDEEDTWKSTEDPDSYEFTWSDGARSAGGKNYRDSATLTIKNLDEGKKYFVKARRYMEIDGATEYGPYCSTATCLTSITPESVVATGERYIPTGQSYPIYWTLSSLALQKQWQIVADDGVIVANGEGPNASCTISAERLAECVTDGTLTYTVWVNTGSAWVVSDELSVTIVGPPTLAVTIDDPLVAQPFLFNLECSVECDIVAIVASQGIVSERPYGNGMQTEGDTIHSAIHQPEWTEVEGVQTTTITLPAGLDFWDLGKYTLTVTATDRQSGLPSNTVSVDFSVAWAHQAVTPEDAVEIEYIDELDDETGKHLQAAQITLTAPTGSTETDVYDIYRMAGGIPTLIGRGFPLNYVVVDEYAPFGTDMAHYYRLVIRTADGDVNYSDIDYVAEATHMRFDWADGTLELPYNISISDSYSKDVDIRDHLDGTNGAYWNSNISRKASLSSDLIRLDQQDDVILARKLAHYPGAVFVRTPDGSAYVADVQVSDMSTEGAVEAIAIDATEIDIVEEFQLPTPFELEGEGE